MLSMFVALAVALAPAPITAGEFLGRAAPLLDNSKLTSMFSSDARELLKMVGETAHRTRARLDTDRAAGRSVSTCLPPKGKAAVDARELVGYLRGLTPAQRQQSFDQAFAGYVARKYPCR